MELAIDPVVDTSLADAHQRANECMASAKAKPNRNDDEDTFAERVVSSLHRLHWKARIWCRPIHADASPSQLNQTNKRPHIARKLRFSESRSEMLFIASLLVEDFRHSHIVFVCFNLLQKPWVCVAKELPLLGLCVTTYWDMPTSTFPID